MKKSLLLLALTLTVGAAAASAQEQEEIVISRAGEREYPGEESVHDFRMRRLANRGYTNLAASMQTLTLPRSSSAGSAASIVADWGASIAKGRTFVMHRRPLARMVYLGLDATWIDLNYARYSRYLNSEGSIVDLHQADVSMGIGPSVHVLPVGKLGVHVYARYNPTFATYFDSEFEALMGGYSSVFVAGGAVYWGSIGLGVEARLGGGRYGDLSEYTGPVATAKTSGSRLYLTLRF